MASIDCNPEHEKQCDDFLRFSAFKRRQHLREVDYSFEEIKDMSLFEARRHQIFISRRGWSSMPRNAYYLCTYIYLLFFGIRQI